MEIYLRVLPDPPKWDTLDNKSHLHTLGMVRVNHQKALLDIHEKLTTMHFPGGQSGISQLLHAASLIVQRVDRGFPVKNAFKISCTDVYMKARYINDPARKHEITRVIDESLESINLTAEEPSYLDASEMTPNIHDFLNDAQLCLMKQQNTNMHAMSKKYDEWWEGDQEVELSTRFLSEIYHPTKGVPLIKPAKSPVAEKVFLHFLINFFERASVEDFSRRIDFVWDRHANSLLGMYTHLWEKLKELNDILKSEAETLPSRLLPWHPLGSPSEFSPEQLQLALRLSLITHIKIDLAEADIPSGLERAYTEVTVEGFSRALIDELVPFRDSSVLVVSFTPVAEMLSQWIQTYILEVIDNLSWRECINLRRDLMSLRRFYDQGNQVLYYTPRSPLYDADREEEITSNIERSLQVHYQWMLKFVERTIQESQHSENAEVRESLENLKAMLSEVKLSLHSDYDGYRQLAKMTRKIMKFLKPYNSAEIIDTHNQFERIITELSPIRDIHACPPLAWKLRLMIIQMKECAELRESLIKTWQEICIDQDFRATREVLSRVEEVCDEYKLSLGTSEKMSQALQKVLSSNTEKELNEAAVKIQMWPIHEHLFFLLTNKLQRVVCDRMVNPETQLVPPNVLSRFIGIPSIPINLLAILDALLTNASRIDHALVSELFSQLDKFRDDSLAFRSPEDVLGFAGVSRDDADTIEIPADGNEDHVHSILQPTLLLLLSNLILNKTDNKKETPVIKASSLGTSHDKAHQLQVLNESIWKNSIALNSKDYDFHHNDFKVFLGFATNYLRALSNVGDDETVKAILTSPRLNMLPIAFRYQLEFNRPLNELRSFVEESRSRPEICGPIDLGMMWTRLGVHQLFLFIHLELIDPVEKADLKIKFSMDCIQDVKNMIYSIGLDALARGDDRALGKDPRIEEGHRALDKLFVEKEDLMETKGFRSPNANYFELLQKLEDFGNIFVDPGTVLQPVVLLYNALTNEDNTPRRTVQQFVTGVNALINVVQGHYTSLHQFSLRLREEFLANYRELVQPILTSLSHVEHGIKILIDEGTRLVAERQSSFDLSSTAESLLYSIVRFPTVGYEQENLLQLIDLCTCTSTREFIDSKIDSMELGAGFAMIEGFRTLKNALSELYNFTSLTGQVTPQIWQVLNNILQQIVLIWQKKEIERDRRRQQEDSLYRHRAQIQGETLSEEEEINMELRKLFPTHREDDFKEIDDSQPTLEATNSRAEAPETEESMIYEHLMTDDDVHQVYESHSRIVQYFVRAPWLDAPGDNPKRSYIEPLLERFKTFSTLLPSVQAALPSDLSSKLYITLNILTSVAACNSQGETFVDESSLNKKPYDFYKSQNVEQVKHCLPILDGTLSRVNALLSEWPEHPTLSSIRTIIIRILSFSIDSPVSRFLTGLELLLVKMREWEENSHAGVSLAEHSTSLIQQIIDWRKLELNCWNSCLETAFERLKAKASKWWFLLFAVVQSYLNKSSSEDPEELQEPREPQEGSSTPEIITPKQMIERLETFMNQSPLVEFQARLSILYTFHSHVYCVPQNPQRDELLAILWNVYNYYNQFTKEVQSRINSVKSPIEKKLKDFVKIVRWNDINYWSVKETIEKTHRTLYKFIREYESGLKQNVGVCLSVKPSNYDLEQNQGEWDRTTDRDYIIDPKDFITTLIVNRGTDDNIQIQNDLINRSTSLFAKSKGLCEQTIVKSRYPALRTELSQFIEDSMAHAISLKSLEVDRTLTKPKQKSHAKSILQQKKMALANYFKSLTEMGMSYRRGLLALKNRPDDIMNFTVPPLEVSSAVKRFGTLQRIDQQMLAQWSGCQSYYYKSLIKLNALNSVFVKVQTDLGVSNMERCSGYSNHLMLLVHNEKKILAENFDSFLILKQHISELMRIDVEDVDLPAEKDLSVCANRLKDLFLFLQINFEQIGIYLHACPRNAENSNVLLLENNDVPMINATKDDDLWRSAQSILKCCADIAKEELIKHEKLFSLSSPSVLRTSIHYKFLAMGQESLQKIKLILANVVKMYKTGHPIMKTMHYILTKIDRWVATFTNLKAIPNARVDHEDATMTEFSDSAEDLIKTILLAIQDKYKEASKENQPNGDVVGDQAEDSEPLERSQLQDNGLREKLIESLEKDITSLRLTDVNGKVEELLRLSQKVQPSLSAQSNLIWRRCLPLLNQYLLFSQFYLNEQVALFRSSCKFLYIQLNVFLDLATNGFCVPKDLDLDDAEADDNGEQRDSDKGGMGLADGEGKKDVSDRIESEDQLEDARPAGEERESNEDKDCKEEEKGIDMSENFDSKLQDLDKKEDDEDDDQDSDGDDDDLDKEMGETEEGTETLDKEIWGDEDQEEEDGSNETDEPGSGEQVGDKEMTAKDDKSKDSDENRDDKAEGNEEEKKEINEMTEPDVNDDQINPYHGNQEPQPEPEPMDLPEDLNLDEGEGKEDTGEDGENPFDIDEMKEAMPPPDETAPEKSDEKKEDPEDPDNASEDEDANGPSTLDPEVKDLDQDEETPEEGSNQAPGTKDEDPTPEEPQKSEEQAAASTDDASDQTDQQSATNLDGTHDKVPDKENQNDNQEPSASETHQDDGEDKGTGQAETEDAEHGHLGAASQKNTPVQRQETSQKPLEKRKNPGESDENRALVDNIQPDKKKQKMVHSREESTQENDEAGAEDDKNDDVDMCQHVKEAEKYDSYATDAATEEQAKKQKPADGEEPEDKPDDDLMEVELHEDPADEANDEVNPLTQNPEETPKSDKDKEKSKTSSKGQALEDSQLETKVEVEGENVETLGAARAAESTYYTNLIEDSSVRVEEKRREIETMLSQWTSVPTTEEALTAWNRLCSVTEGSARDLTEKLRLVLEPTQATRLRGDYRTGKRLNMRKIIPYIASQFRKDKIWLRRTKPSKRDYQVVLALDDSSSMADNHSKELAFESLSLISKAMGYLEVGDLGVVSFGEAPKVLHPLGTPFTEQSGARLLQEMKFDQKNTKIAELVDFTVDMFEGERTDNAKLLVILSDGMGFSAHGLNRVVSAVRRAKHSDIFIVFIIVENPNGKNSILDVRNAVFDDGKVVFHPYLDSFPFPFYMILKDINALPGVLSDALRQWFEVVGKIDT